ncbi:Zn-dependent exopeptidase [Daldinia bambusicola]|nr:Zn-dependent exopeptidase [Daldinia bambusicola]
MSPVALQRRAWLQFLLYCNSLVAAVQYGENHAPVEKDEDLVAANFPDTNETLYSPAFANPESVLPGFSNGTDGPTDDATLAKKQTDLFLRSIAGRNDWAHYKVADFTSEEGRAFPYVVLSKSGPSSRSAEQEQQQQPPKLRVWIQGGVHGNEPAGDQAVLALLGKLDARRVWRERLLEKLDIALLPRYNPDGAAYFQRALASNLDPNREHTKLVRGMSRGHKRLLSSFAPHVTVDVHEFTGTRPTGKNGIYKHGMDALVAAGKNLNTHADIRNISEGMFARGVGERLVRKGFRWEPYFTIGEGGGGDSTGSGIVLDEAGSDAKSGRNNYALAQSVAILCEVRGIRLADQHFQRRVATALSMVGAILDIAVANYEEVYRTVEGAIEKFIHSNDPIILTDFPNPTQRNITFVDRTTGKLTQVPVTFLSTTPTTANQTRARPEAYLIPRTWSDLASRLRDSGVVVETLREGYRGPAEALTIASASVARGYYEGAVQVTVTTDSARKEDLVLPPGSFRVSTRQKNAALAFVALEPENVDSYVRFNLLPVRVGDEYPIFRIPRGIKGEK